MTRFTKMMAALSQLLNCWFLGGEPNETISGRAFRQRHTSKSWGSAYRVVNAIFFWQDDHCYESYYADVTESRLVVKRHESDIAEFKKYPYV